MSSRARPSWTALCSFGFRPLYPLSCLWALISVALWVYHPAAIHSWMLPLYWHAHEMLWGFVVSIAAGFLLTAAANWTGRNPLQGKGLVLLCVLWLMIRASLLLPSAAGFPLAMACSLAFYSLLCFSLGKVIVLSGNKRNLMLPVFVATLGISDLLFLYAASGGSYLKLMQYFYSGLLLMCLVTLLIARRVIPFFTSRAIPQHPIPMHLKTGMAQLLMTLLALACFWLNWPLGQALALSCIALLVFWQTFHWWSPGILRIPLLWVLYVAWISLACGLLVAAAQALGYIHNPAWAVHTIGMGGFSIMIMGMITRTALGHTGLPLKADRWMVCMYLLVICATALRLLALGLPAARLPLLHTTTLFWGLALALYLWRFVPVLIRPRADAG